jgi:heptosyltransferase-2
VLEPVLLRRLDTVAGRVSRTIGLPHGTFPHPEEPARILVVKLHGLGNLCTLFPWLAALQDKCPRWDIQLLTLQENLAIKEALVCPVKLIGLPLAPVGLLRTLAVLGLNRYDLVLDAEPYAEASRLLARVILARSYMGLWQPALYPAMNPETETPAEHIFLRLGFFFSLAAGAHLLPKPIGLKKTLAGAWPEGEGMKVLVHPGSGPNALQRRWPPLSFSKLIAQLLEDDTRVVLTCTLEESDLARQVLAGLNAAQADKITVSIQNDLQGFCQQVASSDLVVCNDSFPVHLASLLSRPVIGLFGPNTPDKYGPWGPLGFGVKSGVHCSPCMNARNKHKTTCEDNICMQQLAPEIVLAKIQQVRQMVSL